MASLQLFDEGERNDRAPAFLIERVKLDEAANRIVATSVVPYPPGIPMLMPGESTGAADGAYIGYLRALRDWDRRFPGFAHETHGVEVKDGEHYLQCLKTAP